MITKPCRIYAVNPEPEAMEQLASAMNQPFVVRGAAMPDLHKGYSAPIGSVIATDNFIVPAWVGYDIGCGVAGFCLNSNVTVEAVRSLSQEIMEEIYRRVPVGFAHHTKEQVFTKGYVPTDCMLRLSGTGWRSLGTVGGNNHFCEIGYDSKGSVWIIVHSGSRDIGHVVATHYMKLASGDGKAREGHFGFPADSELGLKYRIDHDVCLSYAYQNRARVIELVSESLSDILDLDLMYGEDRLDCMHNFVTESAFPDGSYPWVHRKGATKAFPDRKLLIPGNRQVGTFLTRGLGNPEALGSCSHGAGRRMGRKAAEKTLSLEEMNKDMEGIAFRATEKDLGEAPRAYKDPFEVMELQKDLTRVVDQIKPIISIKG